MPQELPEYEEVLRQRNQRETETRLQAGANLNIKPDDASRVLNLQGQTGLPRDVIYNDLDYIEEQSRRKEFDPQKYRKTNPKFAQFAADNPYHLSVLEDDEENMTRTEWAMDALFDWSSVGMAVKHSFAQEEMNFIGLRQKRNNGIMAEGDAERMKELGKWVVDHDFDTSWLKSVVVETVKQSANIIGSLEAGLQRAKYTAPAGFALGLQYGAAGGTAILPGGGTAVGAGAVALFGAGVGFTVGSIQGRFEYSRDTMEGEGYNEFRDMGFTHEDAAWASDISGNINGLLEAVGVEVLFAKLPGMRVLKGQISRETIKHLMGRTTFREVAKQAVKDLGAGTAGEVVTEVLQEATQMAMGEALKYKTDTGEYLTIEKWVSRISDITVQTIKATVLLAGMGPGQRLVMDGRRARNAKAMEQAFIALGESSKDSKVRKNVKGKYREFVDSLTEDGALKHILVSPDRFDQYFQGQGIDPDEIAKELNIENIDEARELGHKVKIPIGDYAEKIAPTDHHNGLRPDITTKDGEMSGRQAEEFESNKAALEEEIAKLTEPVDEQKAAATKKILDDVEGQLIAAGTEKGAAKIQAKVMVGFINLAERMGMDPDTLYNRMFAGIKRTLPEGMGFEDVDILVDPLIDMLRTGDFPSQREMRGQSLLEMIKEKGGLTDEGGELAARDFGDLVNKGTGKTRGDTLDGMAEAAHEAGFIAERDPELLMEAIERERAGNPVFGFDSVGDPAKLARGEALDQLGSFIEAEGIDLGVLSNEEVRQLLEAGEKFEQIDTTKLQELMSILEHQVKFEEIESAKLAPWPQFDAEREQRPGISTTLSKAEALMPRIYSEQDFGNVEFTDRLPIEGTEDVALVTEKAQVHFDRAVKRRNALKALWKCVSD